ncbi:MAG: 1-deoxy-D-xylulose-5-phosphate reductoisomerase [Elusimicrobia bacterium]|nr:1-deoxy-D-xylulose-5-phosphate reductoisomerase [Elusimicrobiota bacterium]
MKKIAILGSTGSIGVNALDVIENLPMCRVWGLSAQRNVELLKAQVRRFQPKVVVVSDGAAADQLRRWTGSRFPKTKIWTGAAGLERLAGQKDVDLLLSSVVGAVGLLPLLAALKAGKKVALANKEALIIAGDLLMATARKYGAKILPVDSEHSAIFQCLTPLGACQACRTGLTSALKIKRIILTASGGAFYRRKGSLDRVSVAEALAHPTWKMGQKITIDCATLTNKGLEAIEAHHLFGVPMENIQIVIHPQSIVHSLVEFEDGAMLAQLSHPDMRLPIQYALTYPERLPSSVRPLELEEIQKLEFYRPDFRRFPSLKLALKAGGLGGTWPAVFNGANEIAVRLFLQEKISFLGVSRLVAQVMKAYSNKAHRQNGAIGLDGILAADRWARQMAEELSS